MMTLASLMVTLSNPDTESYNNFLHPLLRLLALLMITLASLMVTSSTPYDDPYGYLPYRFDTCPPLYFVPQILVEGVT